MEMEEKERSRSPSVRGRFHVEIPLTCLHPLGSPLCIAIGGYKSDGTSPGSCFTLSRITNSGDPATDPDSISIGQSPSARELCETNLVLESDSSLEMASVLSPPMSESDSIGDTDTIIVSEGEGIRSGGSAGREGVWCVTGPVPKESSVCMISTCPSLLLTGEESPWLLSRRRQTNTPESISRMLRTRQATIPPVAPPISLRKRNLGSGTAEQASFVLTMTKTKTG